MEATLKLICIAIHFVGIGESLSEIQYWDPTNFHLLSVLRLAGPFLTIISADHAVITILIDRHASLNFLVLDFSYLCMLTIQVSCVHAFNLSLRYNYDSHARGEEDAQDLTCPPNASRVCKLKHS